MNERRIKLSISQERHRKIIKVAYFSIKWMCSNLTTGNNNSVMIGTQSNVRGIKP